MQNIFLTSHFKLSEFEASHKAKVHGIVNIAPPEAVENLRRLCEGCLEPLRDAIGLPIIITSGFRTKALNDLMAHTSKTSQHMRGEAADFYVGEGSREELIKAFRLIIISPEIDYDQLILYPNFIHVSYVSPETNRRGILIGQKNGKLGYGRISLSNALKIN